MDNLRKAAEMALEALECALSDDQPYIRKSEKAVETLRQALEQPEHQPVAEAHSGNLRWLIPDEEQPANAKLFLHPSESRFNATYENGAPMYSKTIVKENGDPIMLNKDGARSIFCDVDDVCEAAPVSAKAIRAEALEEAARVFADEDCLFEGCHIAAAIRGLK